MESSSFDTIATPNPSLSIVIVNYNTNRLTIQCLRSVVNETKDFEFEVLVIDNHSTLEDPVDIKKAFPSITLITLEENVGFGIANNIGIEESNGDFILLLNSDTVIVDSAIDKCLHFMRSDFAQQNNIGLMGCRLVNEDFSYQHSTFGPISLTRMLINSNPVLYKLFGVPIREMNSSGFVHAISGAFMLFRSKVFDTIKPFDPDIFMYSEETELCRRRVCPNYQIYFWNDTQVIHIGGASSDDNSWQSKQALVSFCLVQFKTGLIYFFVFIFSCLINMTTYFLLFPWFFLKRDPTARNYLSLYISLFGNISRILSYSRKWGSRSQPLKV